MQSQSTFFHKASLNSGQFISRHVNCAFAFDIAKLLQGGRHYKSCHFKVMVTGMIKNAGLHPVKTSHVIHTEEVKCMANESLQELSEEDDELCPVECVREFKSDMEFSRILEKAKETNSLVVVDFFRTACGSCKYIAQGFAKLCKGSGDQEAAVVFLKHNVIDEYDEPSEVAERLRIKTVPLFHFYKNGVLLEAFPTRDKERIVAAILKYAAPASQD